MLKVTLPSGQTARPKENALSWKTASASNRTTWKLPVRADLYDCSAASTNRKRTIVLAGGQFCAYADRAATISASKVQLMTFYGGSISSAPITLLKKQASRLIPPPVTSERITFRCERCAPETRQRSRCDPSSVPQLGSVKPENRAVPIAQCTPTGQSSRPSTAGRADP